MMKYLRINWVILRNQYIRDSKIFGFVSANLFFQFVDISTSIIFFNIIFANTTSLAGWNFYQVLFLYAFSKGLFTLHKALHRGGINKMGNHFVRTGEYDFYLTKPVNSMILGSMSNPRIFEFVTFVFLMGIGLWSIIRGNMHLGLWNVVWFLILSIFGLALTYCLAIITITPVFWIIKVWSLPEVMGRMQAFTRYPAGIFPMPLKIALTAIFPVVTAAYLPVRTLFYPPEIRYIVYMVVITVVFAMIANYLWKLGEKRYGSASS